MSKEPEVIDAKFSVTREGPPDLIPDETPYTPTRQNMRGFALAAVIIIPALWAAGKIGLDHLGLGWLTH